MTVNALPVQRPTCPRWHANQITAVDIARPLPRVCLTLENYKILVALCSWFNLTLNDLWDTRLSTPAARDFKCVARLKTNMPMIIKPAADNAALAVDIYSYLLVSPWMPSVDTKKETSADFLLLTNPMYRRPPRYWSPVDLATNSLCWRPNYRCQCPPLKQRKPWWSSNPDEPNLPKPGPVFNFLQIFIS